MSLDRIGIYGMGNVGAALLMELARKEPISQRIEVASRDNSHVLAAILDVASAFPGAAGHYTPVEKLEGEYDLVVITAGEQPSPEVNGLVHLKRNVAIAQQALKGAGCYAAVVVGSPVDKLTESLHYFSDDFSANHIFGFGGELDRARLCYALNKRGINYDETYIIGEHGPNAIPVYEGENDYIAVKKEVTQVLKNIKEATGKPRNLATGIQLARLLRAIASKQPEVMCVSLSDNDGIGTALTWPSVIDGLNFPSLLDIRNFIGQQAIKDFEELKEKRSQTSGYIKLKLE